MSVKKQKSSQAIETAAYRAHHNSHRAKEVRTAVEHKRELRADRLAPLAVDLNVLSKAVVPLRRAVRQRILGTCPGSQATSSDART